MDTLQLLQANLLSPMVLAFALGVVATLVRSDLKFPEPTYTFLAIYLLLAIGLKGGAALSETSLADFWRPALATIGFGVAAPIWIYGLLRKVGRFDVANAAALAAHYGSVSIVTFTAALTLLDTLGVPHEGFMPTLVALLEVPAILVAILIGRLRSSVRSVGPSAGWGELVREVLAGKSSILLLGGLTIGFLSGTAGVAQVAPVFIDLFRGVLVLFLLEMGMVAARRFRELIHVGPALLAFAVAVPVLHGICGVYLGAAAGLSCGGTTLFAVMTASASYIAAPIAVRIALPQANPGYYLTAALGLTFPFNLAFGIPLYHAMSGLVHGGC